jgi:type I restriction enzyme S subunit
VDWSKVPGCREEPEHPEKYLLSPGDIVVSRAGSVGVSYLIRDCPKAIFASYLIRIKPLPPIPSEFIAYFFQSPQYWDAIAEETSGITIPNVNASKLKRLLVPLAPLAEQKRIVAKIEELLARVNATRERLAKVPAILKRFRQAVLAAACSGRLTADWRMARTTLEPADQLVERVFLYRQEHQDANSSEETEKNRRRAKTEETGNEKRRIVDRATLPEIPDVWTWVYLPELGRLSRGKSRHRPRNAPHLYGGPYPFIQTGEIARSEGRITSHQQTYSEAGLAQSRLWPRGTVCITIAANIAHSAILTYPACFPDSIVGLIPDNEICLGEYVEFFIRTARADLDQFAPATAQKNINIEILNDVAVPLPPILEQGEIVNRVKALFELAGKVLKRREIGVQRTDRVEQTVLARAFRGELVSTEAELARRDGRSFEAAIDLLGRILRERQIPIEVQTEGEVKTMVKRAKVSKPSARRSLVSVLAESKSKLTPDELFREAGFDENSTDEFYEELRAAVVAGRISEKRPNNADVYLEAVVS